MTKSMGQTSVQHAISQSYWYDLPYCFGYGVLYHAGRGIHWNAYWISILLDSRNALSIHNMWQKHWVLRRMQGVASSYYNHTANDAFYFNFEFHIRFHHSQFSHCVHFANRKYFQILWRKFVPLWMPSMPTFTLLYFQLAFSPFRIRRIVQTVFKCIYALNARKIDADSVKCLMNFNL